MAGAHRPRLDRPLADAGFDPDDPYQLAARRMMGQGWQAAPARVSAIIGS
jgi:hypothetical protein